MQTTFTRATSGGGFGVVQLPRLSFMSRVLVGDGLLVVVVVGVVVGIVVVVVSLRNGCWNKRLSP